MHGPPRAAQNPAFYGAAFLLAFVLSVVMLITDKNLRTNFGTISSGYYFHWYVVAATAVADIVGAALLFLRPSRMGLKIGVIGSGLLAVIFLGDILTYSLVGFSSASAFANYLFGISYFGGDIRYLYDALLAVYIATFLWGIVSLVFSRSSASSASKSETMPPPSAQP
jgi:hypothetical protein